MKMKIFPTILLAYSTCYPCFAIQQARDQIENMKINYSTGYQIGSDFDRQGIKLSPKLLIRGILDADNNSSLLMELKEMRKSLGKLRQHVVMIDQEKFADIALNNKNKGAQFLLKNKQKNGVVVLPSGLQYQIIKRGKGLHPRKRDYVTVRYRGTLLNRAEIDNTLNQESGVTLKVDHVIKGWSEALIKMLEGAKWRLFIPPHLGFGDHAFGKNIPPNSTLIYEVELVKVN